MWPTGSSNHLMRVADRWWPSLSVIVTPAGSFASLPLRSVSTGPNSSPPSRHAAARNSSVSAQERKGARQASDAGLPGVRSRIVFVVKIFRAAAFGRDLASDHFLEKVSEMCDFFGKIRFVWRVGIDAIPWAVLAVVMRRTKAFVR